MSDFSRDLANVSWNEVFRKAGCVFMRRGTGETGWWHTHIGEADYGGNPMDFKRERPAYVCRTCGHELSARTAEIYRDAND